MYLSQKTKILEKNFVTPHPIEHVYITSSQIDDYFHALRQMVLCQIIEKNRFSDHAFARLLYASISFRVHSIERN